MYSERDQRFNIKYKKKFDYKLNNHGQSCRVVRKIPGRRCPCYNPSTGYGDLDWHRKNPDALDCDENCFLYEDNIEDKIRAFILPAKYAGENAQLETILAAIGQIQKDDYIYIGSSDYDIFNIDKETDQIIYNNKAWTLLNPDVYKIGDVDLAYMAILRLLGDSNV